MLLMKMDILKALTLLRVSNNAKNLDPHFDFIRASGIPLTFSPFSEEYGVANSSENMSSNTAK